MHAYVYLFVCMHLIAYLAQYLPTNEGRLHTSCRYLMQCNIQIQHTGVHIVYLYECRYVSKPTLCMHLRYIPTYNRCRPALTELAAECYFHMFYIKIKDIIMTRGHTATKTVRLGTKLGSDWNSATPSGLKYLPTYISHNCKWKLVISDTSTSIDSPNSRVKLTSFLSSLASWIVDNGGVVPNPAIACSKCQLRRR